MNIASRVLSRSAAPAQLSVTPVVGRMLQRCASGHDSAVGGVCDCERKPHSLQRKLTVGASNDRLEQEADRVADQVLVAPTKVAANMARPCIQRFTHGALGLTDVVPPTIDRALASPGEPIEATLRQDMEQRFGHDFSQVRVHSGSLASQSARELGARAYAVGSDIVMGSGEFAPGTPEGRRLVAHELTHVIQQQSVTGAVDKRVMRKGFESTINICHRVLESRKFDVTKGGVRVVVLPEHVDSSIPNCHDFDFGVTLTRSEDWWPDDEIGSCEAATGGPRSFSFANLARGTYYLTVWRNFDHPYCCLNGDILVFDEAVANDSSGCTRDRDLSAMDIVHGALDIAGFVPVLGAIPDGVNAAIYVVEGDWANAGLSAVAMVPAWGDGVKLGAMGTKSVIKVSEKAAFRLGEEGVAKGLKEVRAASKATHPAEQLGKGAAKLEREGVERLEKEAAKLEREGVERFEKEGAEKAEREAAEGAEKETGRKPKSSRCSAAVVNLLHQAVKAACRGYSCSMQRDTCASATAKVSAGYACIAAREKMQRDCWRPGDPGYQGHMQQIADVYAANRHCLNVMAAKCKA
jgi:Domain of unknown function (DUF4157)/Novel toxin 16